MIRENKISQNLMLLAWLVLVLHSTISHHHHTECTGDSGKLLLELSNVTGYENCSDNDLSHCHAFNNLDIEVVNSNTPVTPQLFKTLFNSELFAVLAQAISTTKDIEKAPVYNIILPKQYFISQLSFRGPPTLS